MNTRLQKGFTLIEMLVVMIIVSMTSAILIQAMSYVFRIQQRAGGQILSMQQNAMSEDWFRQVVEGLQPDYRDGKSRFKGSEKEFSGLTTNPLAENYGGLNDFSLSLRYSYQSGWTRLVYGKTEDAPALLSWNDPNLKFVYLDKTGEAHDAWPPPLGKWPQLPAAIEISGPDTLLVATPMGPAEPPPRVQDALGVAQ